MRDRLEKNPLGIAGFERRSFAFQASNLAIVLLGTSKKIFNKQWQKAHIYQKPTDEAQKIL